jgi:hypothetical protein
LIDGSQCQPNVGYHSPKQAGRQLSVIAQMPVCEPTSRWAATMKLFNSANVLITQHAFNITIPDAIVSPSAVLISGGTAVTVRALGRELPTGSAVSIGNHTVPITTPAKQPSPSIELTFFTPELVSAGTYTAAIVDTNGRRLWTFPILIAKSPSVALLVPSFVELDGSVPVRVDLSHFGVVTSTSDVLLELDSVPIAVTKVILSNLKMTSIEFAPPRMTKPTTASLRIRHVVMPGVAMSVLHFAVPHGKIVAFAPTLTFSGGEVKVLVTGFGTEIPTSALSVQIGQAHVKVKQVIYSDAVSSQIAFDLPEGLSEA